MTVTGMTQWFSWFTQNFEGISSNFTIDNGFTTFIGSAFQPATTSSQSGGSVHIGLVNNFASTNMTFSGIDFGFRVVDFVNDGPFKYDQLWLINSASAYAISGVADSSTEGFSVSRVEAVPAPATLALFGLGLAGLGWSRRKKA